MRLHGYALKHRLEFRCLKDAVESSGRAHQQLRSRHSILSIPLAKPSKQCSNQLLYNTDDDPVLVPE